jgi:hypothetical protein
VTQRDGDREDPRPLAQRDTIDVAGEFREEIVGVQLLDNRLQQCARPRQVTRACGKRPQHARADLTPPSIRIEGVFGPEAGLQVLVDVGDACPNLAHSSSSRG